MKLINEYAAMSKDYERTPKAVFAAIAVSILVNGHGVEMDVSSVTAALRDEWDTLYHNGIVPQRAPKIGGAK